MILWLANAHALSFSIPFIIPADPGPTLLRAKARARNFECQRLSAQAGKDLYPGRVDVSKPRGDYIARDAVVCRERLFREGQRQARDEAILLELQRHATTIAGSVETLDLPGRTWLVETFYPSQAVAAKINFATKNALMQDGMRVSDRTPLLSASDLDVLMRMPAAQAYPSACQRYFDTGALKDTDALLAVVLRDPQETNLHAGVCASGGWVWLR